jgi:2'-hydroxybiphenyl-2-sulfinate desulfinase
LLVLENPDLTTVGFTPYGTDAHLKLRTNLDEQSVGALQDFTNFLHRWQFIPNPVDVRSWIEPRVLDAALRGRGAVAA